MNPILLDRLEGAARHLLESYVHRGGGGIGPDLASRVCASDLVIVAANIWQLPRLDDEARLCMRFLFGCSAAKGDADFLWQWAGPREQEALQLIEDSDPQPDLAAFAAGALQGKWEIRWEAADPGTGEAPFVSPFANMVWRVGPLDRTTSWRPGLAAALARWKPEVLRGILADPALAKRLFDWRAQREVVSTTDALDESIVAGALARLQATPVPISHYTSEASDRRELALSLLDLNARRGGRWRHEALELASLPEFAGHEQAVALLLAERPDEALALVRAAGHEHQTLRGGDGYRKLIMAAYDDFDGAGGEYLREMIAARDYQWGLARTAYEILLADPGHRFAGQVRAFLLDHAQALKGKKAADFWETVAEHDRGVFEVDWCAMLGASGELLRTIAAEWWVGHDRDRAAALGRARLESPAISDRIGGAALLSALGEPERLDLLKACHARDDSRQVREAIARLLATHGIPVEAVPADAPKEVAAVTDGASFEAMLATRPKSVKAPAAIWLEPAALPPLHWKSGGQLSELARTFLFQRQAREAAGCVNEEVAPLLPHLDRTRNAAFAHALLDRWFASDMKAGTRWALDVAGLVGDDSIIKRLVSPIPDWCAANAGKRAEWAVHAIALLGSDTALRTLDGLIRRYRNHRKYVGAAAAEALRALAAIEGVDEDEIAERIVPDFGMDEAGERRFRTKAGDEVIARLRPDLKLVWQVGHGKEAAAAPALPADDEAAAKDLRQQVREAVASQNARLERAMIEARRWDLATWRMRFESHPLFLRYAGLLVWSTHDGEGRRLGTFRRYPNGILADAAGKPEEFEGVAAIGLPHPLELDESVIKAWEQHLKRFKVKPPFPQLGRATDRLDPLHANRRELRLAEGRSLDAADLRKLVLGRGWSIGSTQDGGYIYDVFRRFPAAGIEAFLAVVDFHAAGGRGDQVELGTALFARRDPEPKRAHHATMPAAEDPRVLRFDQVPPVVYSETVADLKTILGEA